MPQRSPLVVAIVAWCALVGVGVREIFAYATTPGDLAATPASWPPGSRLARAQAGATLVMFVHPDCPCSRASLDELAGALSTSTEPRAVIVAFVTDGAPGGASWDAAGRIPGVTRVVDDGREARRFGARTSSHLVIYDRDGALRFSGGITGSRGHVGSNLGRDAVERVLAGEPPAIAEHVVFGCALAGTELR